MTAGPLPIAIALALGIALGDSLVPPSGLAWVIAIVLAIVATRCRRRPIVALLVLAIAACIGLARGARTPARLPHGAVADDRGVDRIAGTIDGLVITVRDGFGARLATDGDAVWVWTRTRVRSGERVVVHGRLRTPRASLGPGQLDRGAAIRARGARFELVATKLEHVADEPSASARVWRWASATQATWSQRIDDAGGEPVARAALRGIVVGDRTDIPEALDARWRAVGVYHVLSVSGLHLAVIAGLAFALLRRAIAATPIGGRVRPARWAAPPALAIAIAYTLVTGAQLATLRALVVIALVLVAAALDRPMRLLDAIGVAAIALLALRPADLFDPSFQLSFTAALVLACVPRRDGRGVRAWLARGFSTSLWVTLATAPITAHHFQQVAPGGLLGNLVLTPLLELLALPLGLVGVALDWAFPIRVAAWIVQQVDAIAAVAEHVTPIGRVAIDSALVVAVVVAVGVALAARMRRTLVDVIGWIVICLAWSSGRLPAAAGELRVTFVDVGQGDAAIVELPDGAVWLVDAGGHANARDLAAASAPGRAIARTLAVYGKQRIDLAVISHPHPDHYLGLAALDVPIAELWTAREIEATPASGFAAIATRIPRHTHPPLGVARSQAGVELVVWAPRYQATPTADVVGAADPVRSLNDNSLVVELRYRGRSILFTGDLEVEGEELLVAAGIGEVDVVKVAHHGSPTSSIPALVAATRPELAVISCGRANQFGFPAPAVVERWQAVGADIARTDRDGSIVVRVDAAGALTVQRFATAAP